MHVPSDSERHCCERPRLGSAARACGNHWPCWRWSRCAMPRSRSPSLPLIMSVAVPVSVSVYACSAQVCAIRPTATLFACFFSTHCETAGANRGLKSRVVCFSLCHIAHSRKVPGPPFNPPLPPTRTCGCSYLFCVFLCGARSHLEDPLRGVSGGWFAAVEAAREGDNVVDDCYEAATDALDYADSISDGLNMPPLVGLGPPLIAQSPTPRLHGP